MAAAVHHIGVTVPDVFAAVDWYCEVFGLHCAVEPRALLASPAERPPGLDSRFREGRISCLLSGNGVGLELFQFVDPPTLPDDHAVPYDRRGPWHICFTHPDVETLTAIVVEKGGRLLTPPRRLFPHRPHVLSYVADPWGTTIELMSHAPVEVFAQWPSDGAFPLACPPQHRRAATPHEGASS
ncbi:MAG: VOC family protein [Segniliparus sp.]|uniref:VOC family protein n=1 Tax=Segniliparus sp. TaxID=2804064 RepID=UPI003F419855